MGRNYVRNTGNVAMRMRTFGRIGSVALRSRTYSYALTLLPKKSEIAVRPKSISKGGLLVDNSEQWVQSLWGMIGGGGRGGVFWDGESDAFSSDIL